MAQNKISKNYMGKNPRKAKKAKKNNLCPCCGATIQMARADEMDFFNPEHTSADMLFWRCSRYPTCDTYIAANPETKEPDGLMGGPNLRHKRICIHHWEQFFVKERIMNKKTFRSMCASQIGFESQGVVHTRYMNEMECDSILAHLKKLYENRPEIHALVDKYPRSSMWYTANGIDTREKRKKYIEQHEQGYTDALRQSKE